MRSSQVCQMWKEGRCTHGDRCKYRHADPAIRSRVFVNFVPPEVDDAALRAYFAEWGGLLVKVEKKGTSGRRFAFVSFSSEEEYLACLAHSDHFIGDHLIKVAQASS